MQGMRRLSGQAGRFVSRNGFYIKEGGACVKKGKGVSKTIDCCTPLRYAFRVGGVSSAYRQGANGEILLRETKSVYQQ